MLSIIVPIYNAEKYLKECLDSLVYQDYKNFEIILIDDGSTDNSLNICNQYKERYSNINVIAQSNNGVSLARQKGIEVANGEWIIFVDADDRVEKNMCRIINNSLCEVDIIMFDINFERTYIYDGEKIDLIKGILGYGTLNKFNNISLFSVCSKAYNKKFLINNKIFFDKDIFNGEDMLFNINSSIKSRKIKFVNKSFYYYRRNDNSITHSYNNKIVLNDKIFLNKLYIYLKSISKEKDFEEMYNEIVLNGLFICIRKYFSNKRNEKSIKENKKDLYNLICSEPYSIALYKLKLSLNNLYNYKKIILLMLKFKIITPVILICKI